MLNKVIVYLTVIWILTWRLRSTQDEVFIDPPSGLVPWSGLRQYYFQPRASHLRP